MGAVAAVFSKSQVDAPRLVAKMLCAMRHRAQDEVAVAWDRNFESASSPTRLLASSPMGHVATGYGFTRILSSDILQPIRAGEGWFCLDGRIVAERMLVGGEEARQLLERKLNPVQFPSIQRDNEGPYSVYFCTDDRLLVTRDRLGLKPTFIGHRNDLVAVASDRKALWAIGIHEIATFPPGGCLKASSTDMVVELSEPQADKAQRSSDAEIGVDELLHSLVESVSIQTAGAGKIAVGFSGGVDSTVLAKIAKDTGADVLLVTVGLGRTPEMIQAESTAKQIGLPIVVKKFSKGDLERYLDRVLWLIEEPSLMKVSIAVAIHWAAEVAVQNGCSLIMLGQGSDELFGGYKRFATILGKHGERAALDAISESIRVAYEVNYQRDDQAVSSLRAELRLPFATKRMTEIGSRVPLKMKVRSSSDHIRKWILREAAVRLGIPSRIAMRPKKAIQHASGIEKAIREIAKKHRLTPSTYLEDRLHNIKDELDANWSGARLSVASY